MDKKLYLIDLDCYARADEKQKKKVKESHCFDLGLLPTKGLQKEFRSFIEERSRQCALATMIQERVIYQRFCRMVKDKHIRAESLQELEWEQWLLKIRSWLLEHGQKLTMQGISVYGKEKTVPSSVITYVRKAYRFTEAKEERDEIEKDIWTLENLDIAYKKNPIKNVQTLNFTAIIQDDLREETKKAVYEHLHHEAIATIIKELTAIRRLSKYLKETYPDIHSAEELNRELLEEYLTYLATEAEGVNNYRADLTNLRGLLETIGKLYGYPHLEILFLASDLPRQVQPKLKSYSDSELIRFNAALAELDEQMERLMVIHQMLGTRISDTLTLQTDCLYRQDGHPMIQIRQMKTTTFVKPISAELELLIEKAIEYSKKRYGDTVYIFVDEKNSKRPMQYNTVQNKVMDLIQKKDLRDDHGELFGFGTHMFRHVYGIRLTELHLDDWTIAKLLGHTSVKNVKFYRKMSLQIIADETREIRAEMSRMIRANLAGWGKNMSKYDKMLEVNHKQSVEKIQRAKLTIQEMIEEEDKVTVPKLMQKTGLSRGFFYKNPEVRKAVDRALQLQAGMVDKRRKILDMAMDNRILQLEQQVAKLKRENETLRKESEAMRKALNKRDLNLIKNF